MATQLPDEVVKTFEDMKYTDEHGVEYWSARELGVKLGYDRWENFRVAIHRAQQACKTSGHDVNDHFRDATKLVEIGSKTVREVSDYDLTRYACYLVAQNGDPRKIEIANAQTYFALRTREVEVMSKELSEIDRIEARQKLKETEKEFARTAFEHGVDGKGISEIRARGDQRLFGGNSTEKMKERLGIVDKRKPLADFLPSVTIKAKDLATEMTTVNTKKKELRGKEYIAREHEDNNTGVRRLLEDRGIKPEGLPAEPDIKKLERKYQKDKKRIAAVSSEKPLKINGSAQDVIGAMVNTPPPDDNS